MNLKRLVSLVLVFLFMGIIAQAQTFYVNNQTGNDANPGTQAEPKLTVASAIIAAPPGSTISVAFTGVNYTEGNITINKDLTFTSTGGTPVFGNADLIVNNAPGTDFTGPFQFKDLTLTAGAVRGASNLTFSGNVTRTAGTVDSQINFTAGAKNFTYNGGIAITSGFELPAAGNTTNFGNLTTVGGGTVLTLNESKTMNGILTTAAALNLGNNILTIVNANLHTVAGNVTNGTLAFSLTGAASVTGNFNLPNITATKAVGPLATLTLTTNTSIGNITASANASVLAANVITVGAVANSGAGNVTLFTASAAATTVASVTNSGAGFVLLDNPAAINLSVTGNIAQSGTGYVSVAPTAGAGTVSVGGTVTNNPSLVFAAATADQNAASNFGVVRFGDKPVTVTGKVTNSATLSGTNGATNSAHANVGEISFASTTTLVTLTGGVEVTSSHSLTKGAGTLSLTNSGGVLFANTSGNIVAAGGFANGSNFPAVTAATITGNGNIIAAARTTGTIGTGAIRTGAVVNTSTAANGSTNGDINFAAGTGKLWGTSVTQGPGAAGGDIILGDNDIDISGNVSNSRTAAGADINSVAATGARVKVIGGMIMNSGLSIIDINLASGSTLAVTGRTENSGTGSITFTGASGGAISFGGLVVSAGTVTIPASHTAAVNMLGAWTVSGGTLNILGAGNIEVSGTVPAADVSWTNGTLNFTGRAVVNIRQDFTIGGATTNPTFTSAAVPLTFLEATPNVTQTIYVGLANPVYPGPVNLTNAGNIPAPVMKIMPSGGAAVANLYVLNNVTINTALVNNAVQIDGARLNVGKNGAGGGDGNFINTTGYTTVNGGLVMMSGTSAIQTVTGAAAANFGNFGVDNERAGAGDVVFVGPVNIVGDFYLAEGDVNPAGLVFGGAAPWPTIFVTEGTFSANIAPFIAAANMVNVTYYGSDKPTGNEIPSDNDDLNNLTVATTNGAQPGQGIVTMTAAATVNGTLTIDANQSLYTGGNVLTLAGATAVVNGNLVDDGGLRVQLAAPTGTVFSGTGNLPSIQVNAGSVGNNLAGAGLVSNGFGADGVWGGAGANADDFNTKDGNIIFIANVAPATSSLTANFSAPAAPSVQNFLNLTTAAGATFTLGANAIMGGNMALPAGSVNVNTFNLTHNGTAPAMTGGVGGATFVGTGNLIFPTAATTFTTAASPAIAANVIANSAGGTLTLAGSNLRIDGNFTLGTATPTTTTFANGGFNLTLGGQNVIFYGASAITGTGTTILLNTAPNTLLTWTLPTASTPAVTNLTVNGNVTLAGPASLTVNGLGTGFVMNAPASTLDIGSSSLIIGAATATPFNYQAGTISGTGFVVWNSTSTWTQGTGAVAAPLTLANLQVNTALDITNGNANLIGSTLTITSQLYLNGAVLTQARTVATTGSLLNMNALTTMRIAGIGNISNAAGQTVPVYAGLINYLFTGASSTPNAFTWPTAQANNVTVSLAANANTVTTGASKSIAGNFTETVGQLAVSASTTFTVATVGATVTVDRNGGTPAIALLGAGATLAAFTGPDVNLVYTGAAGAYNTGPEYTGPVIVRDITIGVAPGPSPTNVTIAASRTVSGTLSMFSTLNFAAGVTTNWTLAQTIPAGSAVNTFTAAAPVGPSVTNWNGGLTVAGTYTNAGTTTGNISGTGTITNNGIMNLTGLNVTGLGTFTMGAGSTLNMTGDATLNNTTVPAAPAVATINTANNLAFTGTLTNAGLNVNFTGTNNQTVALGANRTLNNVSLVKGNDGTVTVGGGNLTLQAGAAPFGVLTLTRGILVMSDPSLLTLNLTVAGGIITNLGYVRNLAQATHYSHVVGRLGVAIPAGTIGRTEWPVGSINPNYRPAAITFTAGNATIAPTTIIVSHVDAEPTGVKNLPLDGGVKFTDPNVDNMIGGKAPYHWSFEATTSLGAAQMMNVELNGTNLSRPLDNHNDLRIIRRFDGDVAVNGWFLEGDPANYSNAMYVNTPAPGDTLLLVRNIGSAGSAIAQRALFTIGIPTQPPVFTAKGSDDPLANRTINENDTYTFTYQANDLDANPQTIVYSVQGVSPAVPDSSYSIDSATGDFEFTPSFDLVLAGNEDFTFVVQAMKQNDSSFVTDPLVINVTHVNRAPSIDSLLADTTNVQILNEFAHEFVSSDPDAGQTLTWALTVDPTGGAATINPATGMFSWTPDTADAGNDYTFTVTVTDDDAAPLADATTFTLSVGYDRVKGDINGDGNVDLLDALLALDAAIEKIVLSGLEHWAGDMDDDGDVTLLDALAILDVWTGGPMAASGGKPTSNILSKIQSYNAIASFGKLDVDQESRVIHLPVNLSNVEGIRAFGFDVELSMEVESITPLFNMPSEWLTASNYKDGKLMIGAIGLEDLASDLVLTLEIVLKDKKDKVSLSGIAKINGKEQVLNQVTVQEIPNRFDLSQNYPNPFNPSTIIKYDLAENVNVTMKIYNIAGQEVATIVNGFQEAGSYQVRWDGTNNFGSKVAAGLYIYRLEAGPFTSVKKMMLIK